MSFFKSNKIFNIILIVFVIYAVITFFEQQAKLNAYEKDIAYYTEQIEKLNNEKKELLSIQENVNSPEYIEKMAREKLDMYLPNERVYIDISK